MTTPEDIIRMIREDKDPNEQQIFDAVGWHLFHQGRRAMTDKNEGLIGCAYRGADETSCAVGCLIPDEVYRPWFDQEGGSIDPLLEAHTDIPENYPLDARWERFFDAHIELLRYLQRVHDDAPDDDFRACVFDGLRRLAEERKLSIDAVVTLRDDV